MKRVSVNTACWARLLAFTTAACLGALGSLLPWDEGNLVGRIAGGALLAGVVAIGLWFALSPRPRMVISDSGIQAPLLGSIDWSDIQTAFSRRANYNQLVCFEVRDRDKYLGQLPFVLRSLRRLSPREGFGDLSVDITGTDLNAERLIEIILRRTALERVRAVQPTP
jgi:hypothetical protein